MTESRAKWANRDTDYPKYGQEGVAFKAGGYHRSDSFEYRAWLFKPDGDENAYYCNEHDIVIIDS